MAEQVASFSLTGLGGGKGEDSSVTVRVGRTESEDRFFSFFLKGLVNLWLKGVNHSPYLPTSCAALGSILWDRTSKCASWPRGHLKFSRLNSKSAGESFFPQMK